MKHIHRIILTTDFSEGARKAYPFAAHIAKHFGAKIFLVHFKNETAPEYSGISDEEHIRKVFQTLKDESRLDVFSEVPIAVKRLNRNLGRSLPLFEEEIKPDLLMTAIRRRKGIEHFVLSDIGEEVLAKSSVPVFVYASPKDPNHIPEINRVLVPVTCPAGVTDALPSALLFAKKFDCKIVFLLVTPPANEGGNWFTKWFKTGNDTRKSVEIELDQLRQSELLDVDCDLVTGSGVPANVIAEFANSNEIDVILIEPHRFEKGICKRVVYRANCSVMKLVKDKFIEN